MLLEEIHVKTKTVDLSTLSTNLNSSYKMSFPPRKKRLNSAVYDFLLCREIIRVFFKHASPN